MRGWIVAALLVGACGGGGGDDDGTGADAPAAGDSSGGGGDLPAGTTLVPFLSETPEHTFAAADDVTADGEDYLAVLDTDEGRIVFDLLETDAPITVNSFVWLTLHHFHDGLAFHRVVDGFVAQGGDPNTLDPDKTTWGVGGPGYMFGLEVETGLHYDAAGVVGMARSDPPDSNGSQFFITLAPQDGLSGDYTIFGRVTEGLDVLPEIVRGEPPIAPTRVRNAYIVTQ